MQPDEILRLAREAGVRIAGPMDLVHPANVYSHELLRFTYLLLDAEREACAQLVEQYCGAWNDQGYALAQAIRARRKK